MSDAARVMEGEARKAIAIDPNDLEAQEILAQAFVWQGNLEAALDRVERALALNRNSASAIGLKGAILSYSGRCSEGRELLLASLRLNPRDPATAMVRCDSRIVLHGKAVCGSPGSCATLLSRSSRISCAAPIFSSGVWATGSRRRRGCRPT